MHVKISSLSTDQERKVGDAVLQFFFKQNTDKEAAKNCVLVWWGDSSLPQLKGYLIQSCAECPDLFLAS